MPSVPRTPNPPGTRTPLCEDEKIPFSLAAPNHIYHLPPLKSCFCKTSLLKRALKQQSCSQQFPYNFTELSHKAEFTGKDFINANFTFPKRDPEYFAGYHTEMLRAVGLTTQHQTHHPARPMLRKPLATESACPNPKPCRRFFLLISLKSCHPEG